MEEVKKERAWTGFIWLRNTVSNFWVPINSGELLEQLSDCEPFSVANVPLIQATKSLMAGRSVALPNLRPRH